jgi:hypothetical protein
MNTTKAILVTALLTATTAGASAHTTRFNCMSYSNGQTFCNEVPVPPSDQYEYRQRVNPNNGDRWNNGMPYQNPHLGGMWNNGNW